MPDETNTPRSVSLEEISNRLAALEASTVKHTGAVLDVQTDVRQTMQQIKEMLAASQRTSVILPPPPAKPASAASNQKKDAWGNPLDAAGKVVPLPQPKAPASAPAAGEAPSCSCSDHEPAHGPKGCTAKGCSCSLTA